MRKTDREQVISQNRVAARKDREAYTFLSLFLIILSFFIVLVSISQIDVVRARLVFNKFSEILQQYRGLRNLRDEVEFFTGFRVAKIRTLQNIESAWSAKLPLLDQELDTEHNTFEVNVPYYEIISSRGETVRRDRFELFRRIANLMQIIGEDHQQVYVDITYFGPFLKSTNQSYSSSLLALGSIARNLEAERIPTHALSIHHVFVEQKPLLRFNFRIDSLVPNRLTIPSNYSLSAPSLN